LPVATFGQSGFEFGLFWGLGLGSGPGPPCWPATNVLNVHPYGLRSCASGRDGRAQKMPPIPNYLRKYSRVVSARQTNSLACEWGADDLDGEVGTSTLKGNITHKADFNSKTQYSSYKWSCLRI